MNEKKQYLFIACAMRKEAKFLIDKLNHMKEDTIYGFPFYFGNLNGKNIMVGISGIGLINMSSMLSIAIVNYDINAIINYGMAGAYGNNIHKKDLIIGSECVNINSYKTSKLISGIDVNLWNFVTFIDGGQDELVIYNADEMLLNTARKVKYENSHIIFERIGSGDVWNKEHEKICLLQNKYKVCCEDMESVAVYQLANRYHIPCISIKGISNNEILNESYDDSVLDNLVEYVTLFIDQLG